MDIIDKNRAQNFFDNLMVDVKKLYEDHPVHMKLEAQLHNSSFTRSPFQKIYRNRFIPINYRNYLWHLLRRANMDLTWLDEFRSYWSAVLNGRPLWSIQDLWFLKNMYRIKFQDCEVPDTNDAYAFLESWQRPELIYQLLHLVCKESVANEHKIWKHLFMLRKEKIQSVLEFGCGTAPITTSLFEFFEPPKDMQIYISDIQTLAFHYAAYKFRGCQNVVPWLLSPENGFLLRTDRKADVIFCITVLEHLNNPLETVNTFHEILSTKGLLVFDYILSEGEGLDTQRGLYERDNVLNFINRNFEILFGHIKKSVDVGLTIVRKL